MANPFNQDDYEEEKAYKKMIVSCIAAASLVVLLFLIVLYVNAADKSKKEHAANNKSKVENEQPVDDFEIGDNNLVSSDLGFWDMYSDDNTPIEDEDGESTPYKKGTPISDDKLDQKNKDNNKKDSTDKSEENDPDKKESNNKKDQIAISDSEGNTVYYDVLSGLKKNSLKFDDNLTTDENGRKSYSDGSKKSVLGIDLCKNDGLIDFTKVKADGIDFAMLRIALRGHDTGIISLDEKFVEYANGCNANNIIIGTYFSTQAINEQEAIEEACYAVGATKNFNIRYPIAIDLSTSEKNNARNNSLSMKDRTAIVKAFCDTVKEYGYKPIIRGSRDFLISKLNLEDLDDYDVWVLDTVQETDYPYEFGIWQYSKSGRVDGIPGNVDLSMSFEKYEER